MHGLTQLFHVDTLALIVMSLVGFIALCVASFGSRYMNGDRRYTSFFAELVLIVIAVMAMACADHMALFVAAWMISNFLLAKLMIHKSGWKAARTSGILALRCHILGAVCIAVAFGLLHKATDSTSIQAALTVTIERHFLVPALILILAGAMTQSAIWPFHRWLISSLNSPTPTSAMMHAGLINGGGFLLTRFAPLYLQDAMLLTGIVAIGTITACVGTLWKLMQSDVKRMLACSTMGQMGFMVVQCGLGLFPAAIAHLVSHGMFKAYLFMSSGGAAQERRFDPGYPPSVSALAAAALCGIAGSLGFGLMSEKAWLDGDSTLVLMVIAFLATTQFALPIVRQKTLQRLPFALILTALVGIVYGASVQIIALIMEPMQVMQPQQLNAVHVAAILAMSISWLFILLVGSESRGGARLPASMQRGYVVALNASQPHPATITANRNQYRY